MQSGAITNAPLRGIGQERDPHGHYARVVDRFVIHGTPVDFRTLCERVVPVDTRYLVLDLDRTLHLGRNMGELLGFEICAYLAYGPEHLAAMEPTRGPGRFAFDRSDLRGSLRYVGIGAQMWAFPGLFYFLWGKLAALSTTLRRHAFLRFGPEPVRRVQMIPQTTLLHQLAELPLETCRELMRGVWRRHRDDQVIEREDIDWLRARCPNLTVVLTSASPQPVVEVAAEMLGIDVIDYTSVEKADDRFAVPFGPGWVARRAARPLRIAPPSRVRINSSHSKIEGLLERFPDLATPGVTSVGITDTGYGEDHCWGEYFTHVVDINSNAPFSPVVSTGSPLVEVHSAHVLSAYEQRMRRDVDPRFVDPRRRPRPTNVDRELSGEALRASLADLLRDLEGAAALFHDSMARVASARLELDGKRHALERTVEDIIRAYNEAAADVRTRLLEELDGFAEQLVTLTKRLAEIERPVSEAAYRLTTLREASRARLEALVPAPATVPAG